MLLNSLLLDIKKKFMVDDQLKAYLYENKIELIDFTPGFYLSNGEWEDDFYGFLFTIYLEDNKISCIENNSIQLITPVNQQTVIYLASLIGTIIDDYDNYDKLKSISKLDCITL